MAFTVQDDTGTVLGANALITVAFFKSYHDDRGNSYASLTPDSVIEQRIVNATDYVNTRFKYKGTRLADGQTTEFPRADLYDNEGTLAEGIPNIVKQAVAEYALRSPLYVDAPVPSTGRNVLRERTKLDVLETEVEYEPGTASGSATVSSFPKPDLMLKRSGFVVTSTTIERA